MNSFGAALNAADYTLEHGGGTFHADHLAVLDGMDDGFAVGLGRTVQALRDPYQVAQALVTIQERFPGAVYYGTWVNPNGLVDVDAVVILFSLGAALQLARSLGQQAVYSFRVKEAIPA